jgi:hypothetical protein
LWGIFFGPYCVACIIGTILDFTITMLIVTLCLVLVYAVVVFIIWKVDNREKRLLIIKEDSFVVGDFELRFDEIIRIDYYRITSIKVWCLMSIDMEFLQNEVYLVQINKWGNEFPVLIGCLDYKDAKEIAKKTNTKLKVY